MLGVFGLACAGVAIAVVINYMTGGRMSRFVRNKLTRLGMWAESHDDPAAGLQRIADDMRGQMSTATSALTEGEALEGELKEKIDKGTAELARIEAKIAALDGKTGLADSDTKLLQDYANLYRQKESELKVNQEAYAAQVADNARFYEQAQSAAERIDRIEADAKSLGVQVRVADAREKFAQMASKFDTHSLAAGESAADKYREMAQQKIRKANARLTVNDKLETAEDRIRKHERATEGDDVLARLRAKRTAD